MPGNSEPVCKGCLHTTDSKKVARIDSILIIQLTNTKKANINKRTEGTAFHPEFRKTGYSIKGESFPYPVH